MSETDTRLLKLAMAVDVIRPVSRAFLPKHTAEGLDRMLGGHHDFFVIVSQKFMDDPRHMDAESAMIFPEGTPGYRQWCGVKAKR